MTPVAGTKYVMMKRKTLIIAWLSTILCLFIGILACFQYANYVDRKSNQQWCGIVTLFNDTYTKEPPATETGKVLATEFNRMSKPFKCQ